MWSTNSWLRAVSTLLIFSVGLLGAIVFIGNVTDYNTNFQFVSHVLRMDTIFPDSKIHYRSIQSPVFHHVVYIFIIILELIIGILAWMSCWKMGKHFKSEFRVFHAQKKLGIAAIFVGIFLWFVIFQMGGGEWFAMWQSSEWNGMQSASRVTTFLLLSLIVLQMPDTPI